ncbi:MAG: hypothetical protein IIY07_04290 [Thermoguttaceae bacterium]|nr:hypothetical protein [Thermoguttaceae bacterium]
MSFYSWQDEDAPCKPPPWQKFWSKVVGDVSRSFTQAVAITQARLAGSNVNHVNP